ncbi:DUF4097 family beta strand repeat-containing protein [Streptomyces boncukensis]|uniref:DUF4097 family beta strand repeat protein n=1 Tax=Streptomyces boncukensis TaxID=2711219 RepID=A0A6G4WUW9_9ACTN|nr:DUF4097 family beta strand repeat-containing protein [Streptomyces boncukensis]NGO68261.1 DUF4097 family beta strand repeat protein [Streptomyces boncukensis]
MPASGSPAEFDTPEPLTAILEFDIGSVRVSASKRATTVVRVAPGDGSDDKDVQAAQQTEVTCSGSTLLVKGPRQRSLFGTSGAISVSVELPAGSDLRASSPMATYLCEGRLGACRLRTSVGDIQLDVADSAFLKSSSGAITVNRVEGEAEINGSGRIDVGEVGGPAQLKNQNGETTVGEVSGELRVRSSNGSVSVDAAHAGVDARAGNGAIRVGEVSHGEVELHSSAGHLEVGVREGSAAWLDMDTSCGGVRNALGGTEAPGADQPTVRLRARTGMGDIVVRRA